MNDAVRLPCRLNDLATRDAAYGLETMRVAGAMGQAMIVERLA